MFETGRAVRGAILPGIDFWQRRQNVTQLFPKRHVIPARLMYVSNNRRN
jgi:hypothetical protein